MNTDNMEPSIRKNELLLIDKSQNRIESSGIYALSVNGRVVVRRYNIREDGFVDSIQDNRAYPSERKAAAEMENLPVLGKVVKIVKDI
jgi:phage repressor protein C with HTH and peptisase S24 domain